MSNNTLKHLFTVFLPLIIGQLFVACKHGNPEVGASLDRIEQVVVLHPDSALIELVILDSLLDAGAVSIEGERQMARYALLKTQTNDKNYIDDTNDSLIIRAVRYYDEHGSKRERMLAHYYLACIRRNAANFSQAYSSFLFAAKLATDYGDNTYAGLSYGNVSCICRELYSGESLYYADLSYQCHQATGDTARINWALMLKGIALNYQKRYPEAESIFDYLLHSDTNAALKQEVLTYYIYQCVVQRQYQRADSLIRLQQNPRYPVDYMSRAIVYEMKGQQNEADSMMQFAARLSATATDKVFELATIALLQNNRKEYHEASQTLFHRAALQDSIVRNILKASVSNIQSNYELQQKELAEYRYSQYRYISVLVACIVVLLLMAAFRYFYSSRKEQQQTINSYVEKASILEQVLMEQKEKISALQNKVEETSSELDNNIRRTDTDIKHAYAEFEHRIDLISAEQEDREKKHLEQVRQLYAKRFIELNDLCESFYRVQGKIDEQKQIYKKVRMLIDGFVEPSQQKKLDSIIDANFDDAMKKVKSAEIGLNEMELQLYRLKVSGFSTVAICLIMHYDNPPAIRKRIQRIRKTILQSESPYKEEIASLM